MSEEKNKSKIGSFKPEKNKEIEKGPLKSNSKNQYGEKHDRERKLEGKKSSNKNVD